MHQSLMLGAMSIAERSLDDKGEGGGQKNDVVIYEQPLMTKRIPITSDNILTRTMKLTCLMMILSKEGNLDFVSVVRTMRLRGAVI